MAPIAALNVRGAFSSASSTVDTGVNAMGSCDSTECVAGISVGIVITVLLIIWVAIRAHRAKAAKAQKDTEKADSASESSVPLITSAATSENTTVPTTAITAPAETHVRSS